VVCDVYGLLRCERCAADPIENCDFCAAGAQWADFLPDPNAAESWPSCRCCGQPANLLVPLVVSHARA